MWSYAPPLRDMMFVIEELLQARDDWADIPRFAHLDADAAPAILEEAGKFAAHILAPTNSPGDLQGCRFENGAVRTPDGFATAYRRYCEAGWPALACDPEVGGQGLPQILNAALYEMLFAVNHSWSMYPGIAHGAYECLRKHGTEQLNSLYLSKIVSGEWLSTMCLTEPQAGTDLGLLRTQAVPQPDGTYAITGKKIFISGGEHDMTDNILHLVLARLPDAPPGTKGLSLFLVPKVLPESLAGARNSVRCDGIEKKMGIKGSATCVMSFDAATAWMIGEPNRGLAAMFVMMNAARLSVGLQGLGHAEMAYQNAARYANERVQMRAIANPGNATRSGRSNADPIAVHPAIRKSILTMRAFVEGERALGYWCAHLLDIAEHHPDPNRRHDAHERVSILTPVVKSLFTENGFILSSAALQVWGGYGYIHDTGIEQTVRDSRISMIYEGTNEIQAIDLLTRKVIADGGKAFARLLQFLLAEAEGALAVAGCEPFGEALRLAHSELISAIDSIIDGARRNPEYPYHVASDFLNIVGLTIIGGFWSRAARIATSRSGDAFYAKKLRTARFYFDFIFPDAQLRLAHLARRDTELPWLEQD